MTSSSHPLEQFIAEHGDDIFGAPDEFRERVFPVDEYDRRRDLLTSELDRRGVDLMIVTAPDTMAWLHGFRSRWYRHHTSTDFPPAQCTVLDTAGRSMFMIESGYHVDLVRESSIIEDIRPISGSDLTHEPDLDAYVRFLVDQVRTVSTSPMAIGVELWSCVPSPAVHAAVEAGLRAAGHHLVDVTVEVRGVRRIKSAAEIRMFEQAQAACDAGLLAVRDLVREGDSELSAWATFQRAVVDAGGEPAALHETIAAGRMMSVHRISSRQPLRKGRVFYADVASSRFGYHGRATRPYFVGPAPAELHELTAVAAGAYEVAERHGAVGTPWQEFVEALGDYYRSTGIAGGAAGYELGLSVPPADWVNELSWGSDYEGMTGVIEAGTVTNFETFNHLILVDTIVFEETGPRFLSAVPRELFEIQTA